jgi:superfamily II DNA or RNA helicase
MVAVAAPPRRSAGGYWEAQGIAELALSQFETGLTHDDRTIERQAFYILAHYYQRTRTIVRRALSKRREPLAQAALRNLVVLHRPLAQMHRSAPNAIPLSMALERQDRDGIVRDLVIRALSESPESLSEATVLERVNEIDALGGATPGAVRRHLLDLQASGHVTRIDRGFKRTGRAYTELDVDAAVLRALIGPELYAPLAAAGVRGLHDAEARPDLLREQLASDAQLGPETANALLGAVASLLDSLPPEPTAWRHFDLLNSGYPRPYQYEAYSVFRGSGYQGQLVESPTGSGKTMIGMLCIQDWLRVLRPGQSILVLVPTTNYQQQWIGELCFNPIGLRLSPELVFSGSPSQLERFKRRTGSHPVIVLMTYAALAQTGSGVGKGGFDVDSIEMFLQLANVQYVVLDEVHKVVEDMKSVSADVTRQLTTWLHDGSMRGLIGFSGTAEAYRPRFAELGLRLAHAIPLDTLIGYGFVAPFAELGVPFANSARERRIRDLLDLYKQGLESLRHLLGGERLRGWFAEVPIDERVQIARDYFSMYRGRADAAEATAKRLREWEQGGEIHLSESVLVTIVQIARGWSDAEMATRAGVAMDEFETIRRQLEDIRSELRDLIYLPSTVARLSVDGFGTRFDVDGLKKEWAEARSAAARAERVANFLSTTMIGLYHSLSDWYMRSGEGRVETIKAVIDAERGVRPVSGVIVFDAGKRIRWRQGLTAPGYDGVAGLFAQLLGDKRFSAFAALSSEMYLTRDEDNPLPPRIASFIESELMCGDVAGAIFRLLTQGLIDDDASGMNEQRARYATLVSEYVASLAEVRARRLGEFRRRVLRPFAREARATVGTRAHERLRARLLPGNVHLDELITTFFDYAELAGDFRRARVAEIEQVSGARQSFFVVPMPGGRRKQLMYDLTARIVDSESLGVNLVIVSTWARTGWNVLRPNVLIDATATRDVTAWQQLRGRAMRAPRTWTNDCYRQLAILASGQDGASGEASESLRAELILSRNKVTHIYELIKAFGSTRQLEFDRPASVWRRRDSIAHKHDYERAVSVVSGEVVQGEGHAPLVYGSDPRTDLPVDLTRRLTGLLEDRDKAIVTGWLRAAPE